MSIITHEFQDCCAQSGLVMEGEGAQGFQVGGVMDQSCHRRVSLRPMLGFLQLRHIDTPNCQPGVEGRNYSFNSSFRSEGLTSFPLGSLYSNH